VRLLASFGLTEGHPAEEEMCTYLTQTLAALDFDVLGARERAGVVEEIADDIDDHQKAEFRRSAFLACREVEGHVVGAASLEGDPPRLRLRFIHPEIESVMTPGEFVAAEVMRNAWAQSVALTIRERKGGRSVLHGEYVGQRGGFFNHINSVAKRGRLFVSLVVIGLVSELVLTGFPHDPPGPWAAFGQRLGAPVLTAGFVGLAELFLAWSDDRRRPLITWSTAPPRQSDSQLAESRARPQAGR
jgi:hypothetical protein